MFFGGLLFSLLLDCTCKKSSPILPLETQGCSILLSIVMLGGVLGERRGGLEACGLFHNKQTSCLCVYDKLWDKTTNYHLFTGVQCFNRIYYVQHSSEVVPKTSHRDMYRIPHNGKQGSPQTLTLISVSMQCGPIRFIQQ